MRLRFLLVVAGFAAGSIPLAAGARELEYHAAPGCPSRDEVSVRLEASAPEGRPARIDVRPDKKKGFHGDVVLGEGDRRLARSVEAKSCLAVVEALALVIALDQDDANADADAKADVNANADAKPDAKPDAKAGPADADVVVAPTAKSPLRVAAVMAVTGTTIVRGAVQPGITISTELASERPLFGVAWMRPSARVGALQTFGVTAEETDRSTRFKIMAVTLEACPIGARLAGETLTLAGCGRGDVGSLDVSSTQAGTGSEARVWATAGGTARLRFAIGKPGMWQPVIEVGGGLLVPLVRDRFYVPHSDSISFPESVAALLGTASIGAGFSFQ